MPLKTLDWGLRTAAVLSLVAIGAAVYYVVHVPSAKAEEAREARIEELAGVKEELPAAQTQLLQVEEELKRRQARAEQVRQRIPDDPCEAEFLKQLTQVADDAGLKIRDYRRGKLAVKDCYSQLQLDLSCTAGYSVLCTFFDRLTRLPRIFTVRQLTITSRSDGTEYPVELSLLVYFRGQRESQEGVKAQKNG